jgi:predicted nucleic acid-binding protein
VNWAYFDTSALIKRYVDEPGRREVLRLLREHDCVASAVMTVEVRSALWRCVRDGSIDAARIPQVLRRFAVDCAFWALVEPRRDVLDAAEALVGTHPLRTLDAIHVASAQLFASRIAAPRLVFVSADARQTDVATALGMAGRRVGR